MAKKTEEKKVDKKLAASLVTAKAALKSAEDIKKFLDARIKQNLSANKYEAVTNNIKTIQAAADLVNDVKEIVECIEDDIEWGPEGSLDY